MISLFFIVIAEKKNKKVYLVIGILIISLLSGLRGVNCGVDTKYYYNAFINRFPVKWMFEEVGFRFVSNSLMSFFNNATVVMIIYSLIINFLIVLRLWDFRDKCNFKFMYFLYICIYFIGSMNIMRQFLALSILFYFTKLLEKKRYLLFIGIVILATLIHQSAILALLIIIVYFWNSISINKKILLIIPMVVICLVAGYYGYIYESKHINNYFSTRNMVNNVNLTYLYRVLIFTISYLLYKGNKKLVFIRTNYDIEKKVIKSKDNDMSIFSILYFLGLCLSAMGMFFKFMQRFGYMYLIFELLYWGYLVKNSNNKNINKLMITVYAVYVFALEIIENGSAVFPYYFNI